MFNYRGGLRVRSNSARLSWESRQSLSREKASVARSQFMRQMRV